MCQACPESSLELGKSPEVSELAGKELAHETHFTVVKAKQQHNSSIKDRVCLNSPGVIVLLGKSHELTEVARLCFDRIDFVEKLLL